MRRAQVICECVSPSRSRSRCRPSLPPETDSVLLFCLQMRSRRTWRQHPRPHHCVAGAERLGRCEQQRSLAAVSARLRPLARPVYPPFSFFPRLESIPSSSLFCSSTSAPRNDTRLIPRPCPLLLPSLRRERLARGRASQDRSPAPVRPAATESKPAVALLADIPVRLLADIRQLLLVPFCDSLLYSRG